MASPSKAALAEKLGGLKAKTRKHVQVTPNMLKFLKSGKKLVIYGPSGAGKTWLVRALLKVRKVIYIDLDGNTEPFHDLPDDLLANLTVFPLRDNPENPTVASALAAFSRTRKLTACKAHFMHECPICDSNSDAEWYELEGSLIDVLDAVIVVDSWGVVHESATNAMYNYHALEDLVKPDLQNYGAVNRVDSLALQVMGRSNYDVLIITHEINLTSMIDRNAKPDYIPLLGSNNLSLNSLKMFNGVWALTHYTKPLLMTAAVGQAHRAITHGSAEAYASKAAQAAVGNSEAVVRFFSRTTS